MNSLPTIDAAPHNYDERPSVPPGHHPIETTNYVLATRSIREVADQVYTWIDSRIPGGMIYGRPRLGKTRAIRYLLQLIPDSFDKPLPAKVVLCKKCDRASEGAFYEDLLRAIGHVVLKGSPGQKRDRYIEALHEDVAASNQDRLILVIDEAQNLVPDQYAWLMDVYNELDSRAISLTVLLFGQPELEHQRTAFLQAAKHQIVGRFMTVRAQFHGLRNEEDVAFCLQGYDELTEFPSQSGWSFSRYFFPNAFESGWRAERFSREVWQAFADARLEAGLSAAAFEIPMQYFCRTIEHLLRRYQTASDEGPAIAGDILRNAVRISGYANAELLGC